ncbi:MAG: (2Fe-2S)-binding protein [Myxococcota bacterium]
MGRPTQRLVCKCMGISDVRLRRFIAENDLKTVDEVREVCNASGTCGACREDVEGILGELAGLPPAFTDEDQEFADMELRLRCEATVENGVAPELEKKRLRIQFIDAYGLTVEVRVEGKIDDGTLKWITDRMRAYIASDLEIVIYRNRDEAPWRAEAPAGRESPG